MHDHLTVQVFADSLDIFSRIVVDNFLLKRRAFMKLCIVLPSFAAGGAEKVSVNLANYYAEKENLSVSLIAFRTVGPYRSHVSPKVKVVDLDVKRARYVLFRLQKSLRDERPTHVLSVVRNSNMFVGMALLRNKTIRVVYREANTMDSIKQLPFFRRVFYTSFMRLAYKRAGTIIANSDDTKLDLVNSKIVDQGKATVIGNPVIPDNVDERAGMPISHKWFGQSNSQVVLNIGRLQPQKNQKLLVASFYLVTQKCPEAKLLMIGEGVDKEALLNQVADLGLQDKVDIIPYQDNVFPYYKWADVFVLSSAWEGFGNVLVEALSCGTPVVSTDCPGGPRSILADGEYGTLVPCGDTHTLSEEIISKLKQSEKQVDNKNVERANDFSVSAVARKYYKAIFQCD